MPRIPRLRPADSGEVPLLATLPRPYLMRHHERPDSADRIERRAMEMWPRLDHRAIHRCCGDPARIAAYVAHRTKMAPKAIETLISA
jgi:hypothetical protein